MVSALDSRLSSPVLAPTRDHRIVFLGKIPCSHSAPPLPDVKWVVVGGGGNPSIFLTQTAIYFK